MNYIRKIQTLDKDIKEAVFTLLVSATRPFVSTKEIASLIKYSPSVKKKTREFLGLTYTKYELRIDDLIYILETKGRENERTLVCKIYKNGMNKFAYHSYSEMDFEAKHRIQDELFYSLFIEK